MVFSSRQQFRTYLGRSRALQRFRSRAVAATVMVPRPEAQCLGMIQGQKPCFHVQPPEGWLNDPNGPIYYGGLYHMFYQYYPKGCAWRWGLYWGHAVSKDMITWKHLPPALTPTAGGPDQDGCWSGCAIQDLDGTATILYTAVRLRGQDESTGDLDLNLPHIETQCLATAAPGDIELISWTKAPAPIIPLPPHKNLGGFRDPFVLGRPGEDGEDEWTIMIGSGIKDSAGTALVYKSPSLQTGWRYDGELCRGLGKLWECPVMARLPLWHPESAVTVSVDDDCTPVGRGLSFPLEGSIELDNDVETNNRVQQLWQQHKHMLAVCPDDCNHPIMYYLGSYANGRFDIDNALGPFVLDLGDILYAPQILAQHPEGHAVLFGWLQERRGPGTYSYSGSLSVPRLLWLEVDPSTAQDSCSNGTAAAQGVFLRQQPLPGLKQLRHKHRRWQNLETIEVQPASSFEVPQVSALHWELVLKIHACTGTDTLVALHMVEAVEGCPLLRYEWSTGLLEVLYRPVSGDSNQDISTVSADWPRVSGGLLQRRPAPGQPLGLQVFFDFSVLEIFTDQGEALTVRVYPSNLPPHGRHMELLSLGGPTTVQEIEAYELEGIWDQDNVESALLQNETILLQHSKTVVLQAEPVAVPSEAAVLQSVAA